MATGSSIFKNPSHPYSISAKAAMIVKAHISTRADISWVYKKIFTISKDLILFSKPVRGYGSWEAKKQEWKDCSLLSWYSVTIDVQKISS